MDKQDKGEWITFNTFIQNISIYIYKIIILKDNTTASNNNIDDQIVLNIRFYISL